MNFEQISVCLFEESAEKFKAVLAQIDFDINTKCQTIEKIDSACFAFASDYKLF